MHQTTDTPQIYEAILTGLKGETDNSIVKVGNFNNPLSIMDRKTRQITDKDTENLNNNINHYELLDIPHLKTAEYTFFSRACKIFLG